MNKDIKTTARYIFFEEKMPRLKLSPMFKNLFDFRGYNLRDVVEDKRSITLFLDCTRKTGDCPECGAVLLY
jgi:hypothetical protein